jgi:hypothetical protein
MEQKGTVRLAPVCRWYRRKVAQDLSFFLILQPNTKEGDELWVHVAWSRTEDHSDLDGNFDQCFNVGKLWNAPNGWFTWELTDPAYLNLTRMTDEEFAHWGKNMEEFERLKMEAGLRQAPVCVQDAIDRIVAYAVPFFDRVREDASIGGKRPGTGTQLDE